MKEQEVHQLIENSATAQKARVFEQIREEAERSIVEGAKARRRRKYLTVRWLSIAAVFVVVCISVVLPIILANDSIEISRYDATSITVADMDITLKDYCQENKLDFMFLNRYEGGGTKTSKACEIGNIQNIVYLKEKTFDVETGYSVTLTVMKKNVEVTEFKDYENSMSTFLLSNGTSVAFRIDLDTSKVNFIYNEYKYYLDFLDATDLNYVKSTVESMFKN